MEPRPPLRIAVLASGRGSNLQALIEAQRQGVLNIDIVGVFGDRPDALALQRAQAAGIRAIGLSPKTFGDRRAFDQALFSQIAQIQPQLIVCAGYLRIMSADIVTDWQGRMINIHPSLLPAYPGLRTHERALVDGAREHGASVHFVTAELDGGPVISRVRIPVETNDTPASLAARVLEREHPLLVATVRLFTERRLEYSGHAALLDGSPLAGPLELGADNRLSVRNTV